MKDLDQPPITSNPKSGSSTSTDKTPWYKHWWIYPVLIIILALIIGTWTPKVDKGESEPTKETTQSAATDTTPSPQSDSKETPGNQVEEAPKVGTPITHEELTLVVDEVVLLTDPAAKDPKEDPPHFDTYRVDVTVTNDSDDPRSVDPESIMVIGRDDGNYFGPDLVATRDLGEEALKAATLEAGETISGSIIFDVPYPVIVSKVAWFPAPTGDPIEFLVE